MNKILYCSAVFGAVSLVTGCATDTPYSQTTQYAPQQRLICHDEVVTHSASGDQHRIIGTVTGAALGGLVGNQFGGGTANKAITAAGVVAGGYAGNQVQERMQEGNTTTTTQRVCEPER